MSPEDVFTLIGRYYPDMVIIEKEEDGEISFQTSFQEREFCRFGRDGRANIFNFGKGILKKMYHYDVQDEREWVTAFSRENGIDMRYAPIEAEATILDVDAGVGFWSELTVNINPRYSKAHLRQDAWQYKDNIRNCKVCYFGKPVVKRIGESGLIEAIAPELLKEWLDNSFKNVSFPSGTLQVRADND
jgi:hypothetical protein